MPDFAINEDVWKSFIKEDRQRLRVPGTSRDNPTQNPAAGAQNLRTLANNFGTPEALGQALVTKFGPENVAHVSGYKYNIFNGEEWEPIDSPRFEVADLFDIGGDLIDAVAGAGSAVAATPLGPGAQVVAAGAGSGAARALMLELGEAMGLDNSEGKAREIGISAGAGAAGEGLALGGKALLNSLQAAKALRNSPGAKGLSGIRTTREVAEEAIEQTAKESGEKATVTAASREAFEGAGRRVFAGEGIEEGTEQVLKTGTKQSASEEFDLFMKESLQDTDAVRRQFLRESVAEARAPTTRLSTRVSGVSDDLVEAVTPVAKPKPGPQTATSVAERQVLHAQRVRAPLADERMVESDFNIIQGSRNQREMVAISREDPSRRLRIVSSPSLRNEAQFTKALQENRLDDVITGLEYWQGKKIPRDTPFEKLEAMVEEIKPELLTKPSSQGRLDKMAEEGKRTFWVLEDSKGEVETRGKFRRWRDLDLNKWDVKVVADVPDLKRARFDSVSQFLSPRDENMVNDFVRRGVEDMRSPQAPIRPQQVMTDSPGAEELARDLSPTPMLRNAKPMDKAREAAQAASTNRSRAAQLGAALEDLGKEASTVTRNSAVRVAAWGTGHGGHLLAASVAAHSARGIGRYLQKKGVLEGIISRTTGHAREKFVALLKMRDQGNHSGFSAALHVIFMDPVAGSIARQTPTQ